MKNVLLLVHDDTGQEARFRAALDLTKAIGGHMMCLDVVILPALMGVDYSGSATAILLEQEDRQEAANRSALEARIAKEAISSKWQEVTGWLSPCLKDASELADIIVVNRRLDEFPFPDMRGAASKLVVESGKPVLAVPEHLEHLDLSAAVVAWDGSRTSAAALHAATPLLALAKRVTVLEVADGTVRAPAEDAVAYLALHGIEANVEHLSAGNMGTAAVIADYAVKGEFGYIVMGGFSHRRVLEALFGGTTRALLTNSPLPLFLAH